MPALRTLKVDYDEALDAERGESCGCVLTKASRHGEPQQSPKTNNHAIGYASRMVLVPGTGFLQVLYNYLLVRSHYFMHRLGNVNNESSPALGRLVALES